MYWFNHVTLRSPLDKLINLSLSLSLTHTHILKNIFLQSFYKLRNKRPTPPPPLRRDHFLLRLQPLKGLLTTWLNFKNVPHIDFLELHGKQAKDPKDA